MLRPLLGVAAAVLLAAPVHAQVCTPARPAVPVVWGAPLDRGVTLNDGTISVRAALDRVAAAANIRFTYSTDLIPADRFTCLLYDDAPLGLILNDILRGTSLAPVVAGGAHIVLAPARRTSRATEAADSVVILDGLVVDGVATRPTTQTAGANVTVMEARDVAEHSSVADAINAHAGGVWAWEAHGLTAQFGGMRGASSLGMNVPKVYIDGIEVANPLLLAYVDPGSVERIELIRGPQGAAMYGGNAIGGVTNISTRRPTGGTDSERFRMRSGLGIGRSVFTREQTVAQDHGLHMQLGSSARAANVNLAFGSTGEFTPGTWERHVSADGTGRVALEDAVINGTMRVVARQLGAAASPLMPTTLPGYGDPFTAAQYTAGLTATFTGSERWTHAITAGADGYALGGTFAGATLSAADSALIAAGSAAVRATLRLRSTTTLSFGALTISADHSMLHQDGGRIVQPTVPAALGIGLMGGSAGVPIENVNETARLRSSSGLGAQVDATVAERLALSGGLRIDRGVMSDAFDQVALLPMVGGRYRLTSSEAFVVSLRAAYGKGVRWPDTRDGYTQLTSHLGPGGFQPIQVGPEVQAGIEAGFDVAFGHVALVQVTRFDQTASGLTQLVEVQRRPQDYQPVGTALRNVGEIANSGWEVQGSVNAGRFGIGSALSIVDSRVRRLATGYGGDLRVGDRMLGIPANAYSITTRWTDTNWRASLTAHRALDWINYDRIALAFADPGIEGAALRDYWIRYNGVTHLRASFAHTLNDRFTLTLAGDNLLDRQIGEPDNVTVVPGRTFSVGLRAIFQR